MVFTIFTWPVSRRWLMNWGSTVGERDRRWPGDDLVSSRETTYTRAIGIEAAAPAVWPWVVQFGLDRAGFYSYELLERLVGIPVRNVEEVVPRLQSLAVGDEIRLHPKAPGIPVGVLDTGSHVCFGERHGDTPPDDAPDPNRSWSIYVVAVSADSSRLVLRGCIESLRRPSPLKTIVLALEEPIDFVMEQRMIRTLKRLAEA